MDNSSANNIDFQKERFLPIETKLKAKQNSFIKDENDSEEQCLTKRKIYTLLESF